MISREMRWTCKKCGKEMASTDREQHKKTHINKSEKKAESSSGECAEELDGTYDFGNSLPSATASKRRRTSKRRSSLFGALFAKKRSAVTPSPFNRLDAENYQSKVRTAYSEHLSTNGGPVFHQWDGCQFTDWKSTLKKVEIDELLNSSSYRPRSMPVRSSVAKSPSGIPLFATTPFRRDLVINCGGPISSMTWCSDSEPLFVCSSQSRSYLLALSTFLDWDLDLVGAANGFIQLWQVDESADSVLSSRLLCLLKQDGGTVLNMDWCLSSRLANKTGQIVRLGLLAVAGSDGRIRIFIIPPLDEFQNGDAVKKNQVCVVEPHPCFNAICGKEREPTEDKVTTRPLPITRISWYQFDRRQRILALLADGSVLIQPLPTEKEETTLEALPIWPPSTEESNSRKAAGSVCWLSSETVCIGLYDRSIVILNWSTGEMVFRAEHVLNWRPVNTLFSFPALFPRKLLLFQQHRDRCRHLVHLFQEASSVSSDVNEKWMGAVEASMSDAAFLLTRLPNVHSDRIFDVSISPATGRIFSVCEDGTVFMSQTNALIPTGSESTHFQQKFQVSAKELLRQNVVDVDPAAAEEERVLHRTVDYHERNCYLDVIEPPLGGNEQQQNREQALAKDLRFCNVAMQSLFHVSACSDVGEHADLVAAGGQSGLLFLLRPAVAFSAAAPSPVNANTDEQQQRQALANGEAQVEFADDLSLDQCRPNFDAGAS